MRIIPAMLNTEVNERNVLLTVLLTKSKQMVAKNKKAYGGEKKSLLLKTWGNGYNLYQGRF